ncbi:calponin homology domain-containing protein DDB_G0272472-like [Chironomus tepperi]|uniref:calponin homology domain-containing protein DDB_G0272472-like n=1 Tax=Chironomus tepperi TaxID=113505 RepID=UPI00391EFDD0
MDEKSIDPLELKKKILFPHLEFVKEMLVKVKGNSIEEKWKIMYECITSDKKRPSYEKIKQMEKTLIALKNQSKQKSNATKNNSTPSTSKATIEKSIPKETKTAESIEQRDPRKRICEDKSSTVIYDPKQKIENKSKSRSPARDDNQSPRFHQKVETDRPSGRWSDRPSNSSRYNEKYSRNLQEFSRGRGRHPRGRPYSRPILDPYESNSRFHSNQRHSSNDRQQFRDERNRSLNKDDPNFKRKRSQSPVSHTTPQMPKRRYSCYQPSENDEEMDSDKFKRQSSTDNSKSFRDNKTSSSKNAKLVNLTSSNKETKVERKNDDNSSSNNKLDNLQSVSVKNKIDKKEAESSVPKNLSEAIKKIQSIKIPKLGVNKNVSKTELQTKAKYIDKNMDSNDLNDENTSTKSTAYEKRPKIAGNLPKTVDNNSNMTKSLEKITNVEKVDKINPEIKAKLAKCTENYEIAKKSCNSRADKTETEPKLLPKKIESQPISTDNVEVKKEVSKETIQEIKLSEIVSCSAAESAEIINHEASDEIKKSIATANEKLILNTEIEVIDPKELESKDQNDKIIESTSIDVKIIDTNVNNDQDEPTSSIASNNAPDLKANVLTNLLENEEENPEKVLEGLISVLGVEKVKKMQDLLLKNTLKVENMSETKSVDENKQGEASQSNSLLESKVDAELTPTLIKDESKSVEDDAKKMETSVESVILPTIKTSPIKTNLSFSPEKKRKKPRKKKLTELDKLHENILSSIDCEGIMRACGQPRVSVKPKTFEKSGSMNKNLKTKPLTIKLLRLNITKEDMPVTLNDEFYQKYLTIQETKSRTKPKSQKRRTISQEKPIMKVAKIEPEFKTEPTPSLIVQEVPVEEIQQPLKPLTEIIKTETNIEPETQTKTIITSKKNKKRKMLSWSKGILKKKPKRFRLGSLYDWEDVDSSDDNISYDRTMKLNTFKDLLNTFAKKCGYKKMPKKSQARISPENGDQKVENFVQNDIQEDTKTTEKSVVNEDDSKFAVPKRINLPLEKNLLTMISKNTSSEINSPTTNAESPNLKIKIKLPTVEKSVQETQQSNALVAGPSNEMNTKIYSSQNNPQKVVIVKPLSKEILNEPIKIRTLSAKEQQALKDALSGTKHQISVSSISQQSNEIIKNMMNVNSSLNITKISAQKSPNASTSKDEPIKKSIPMISNVESISPKLSKPQNNSSEEQSNVLRIVSSKSTAEATDSPGEQAVLPHIESTASLPEPVQSTTPANEPVEIVDLIDDDDEDDVVDIMRPWIEKSDFKSRKDQFEAMKMINNTHCIAALYKCMGTTCSYFTNDKSLFQKHLELHREYQKRDSQNYLLCSYCSFRPKSINVLLVHIENAHSYGKFGCRYCFYRSINEYQVTANHHSSFHRLKEKCVVVFEPRKVKNENIEKSMISESIPKVCHPFPCPYCRIGFYTIAEFEAHVSSHKENFTTVCVKCNQTTTKLNISQHLLKCFNKFGNFQCVFCVFGTNVFSAIDNHLSSEHPDKLSYFAERSLNEGKDPKSIESLTTKELSKRITGNVKKMHLKYPFNDEVYKNSGNVGRLADNLNIDPTERPLSSDSSCFLQIGEVMSLHD